MSSKTNDEKIVILPAVQLDILIFHASKADINGNVQIGRRRELATLAHASKKVYVTVEEIVDEDYGNSTLNLLKISIRKILFAL